MAKDKILDAVNKAGRDRDLASAGGSTLIAGAIGLALVGSVKVYDAIKNRKKKKK